MNRPGLYEAAIVIARSAEESQAEKVVDSIAFDMPHAGGLGELLSALGGELISRAGSTTSFRERFVERALELIEKSAEESERWAMQSKTGGWSTHQVDANLGLASRLRMFLAESKSREPTVDCPSCKGRGYVSVHGSQKDGGA